MLIKVFSNCSRVTLTRRTLPGPFAFEFQLPPSGGVNGGGAPFHHSAPTPSVHQGQGHTSPWEGMASGTWNFTRLARDPQHNVLLENDLPSVLQFPIEVEDIGGTLTVRMALNPAMVSVQREFTLQLFSFRKIHSLTTIKTIKSDLVASFHIFLFY